MKKLLFVVATVALSLQLSAQSANLKLNPEKNMVYRFKSVSSQNVSQTVNGMEQTTTTSSSSVFSLKMMEASSNFIVAEVRFDTIQTTTNTMGKTSKINSASEGNIASEDAGEVMSAIMNKLSKSALYVKMNPRGEVVEIINAAMIKDLMLKDTGLISSKLAPVLKPQIKNTVSADALKTMVNMYTFNLPGGQVKVRDQWEINVPVSAGGMSLQIITNYNLESVNNNLAQISAESSVKAAPNAAPLEYPGAKITYDAIKGFGKSTLKINAQTGLTVENFSKSTISGDLNVNASGMSMQIPMNITSETTIKVL